MQDVVKVVAALHLSQETGTSMLSQARSQEPVSTEHPESN